VEVWEIFLIAIWIGCRKRCQPYNGSRSVKASPLQLRFLIFEKVLVEANSKFERPSNQQEADALANFDFDGVSIKTSIQMDENETNDDADYEFSIAMGFKIDNEEGKQCPYSLELLARGFFTYAQSKIDKEEIQNRVRVNGCSMIFASMREMVWNITSRSSDGPFVFPTVNFLDLKELGVTSAKSNAP